MSNEPGIFFEGLEAKDHYTITPNNLIRHKNISLAAKMLWVYINSHSRGYELGYRQITLELGISEDTCRKYFQELAVSGWLRIEQTRQGSHNGKLRITLIVPEMSDPKKPDPEKPDPEISGTKKTNNKEDHIKRIIKKKGFDSDWKPGAELVEWANKTNPNLNVTDAAEQMIDYLLATGKASEVKDIDARFRTWVRNSVKFGKPLAKEKEAVKYIGQRL